MRLLWRVEREDHERARLAELDTRLVPSNCDDGPRHAADAPGRPDQVLSGPDDMGVTANAICKDCNEGWMNDLEAAVRPFLTEMIRTGTPRQLTLEQQASLAKWSVKTTMVFEFRGDTTPFYTFEQRNDLRHNRIPAATLIWVGRYEGTTFLSTAVAKGSIYDVTAGNNTTRQPGNALTISIGQFVVQVLSTPSQAIWILSVPS